MATSGQILGPFLAPNKTKIGEYVGFRLFSCKFSAGFTWNFIYKLNGATFVGILKIGPRGPNFWAILDIQISKNYFFRIVC